MKSMDIHQLRVFVSVYKNRSFSRASEQMHLTQPTISDHIRSLEQEFDCRLFDRLGRSILPTQEAEALFIHAVDIIERAEAIKDVVSQFRAAPAGTIVIGASTIPGTYLLPKLLASFRLKYPDIFYQVAVADSRVIVDRIASHDYLAGIVGTRLPNQHLNYTPLCDDELIAVASPAIGLKPSVSLHELLRSPMVVREEGSGTRKEIERIFESKKVSFNEVQVSGTFGSTEAIKEAVKAGLGVSVLSRLAVQDELAHGTLQEIAISGLKMKRQFYLVTHQKRTLPPAYAVFSKHLVQSLKK